VSQAPLRASSAVGMLAALAFVAGAVAPARAASPRPNIVYILCDDLGYGDVQTLSPERGAIPTPSIDRLAAQGMVFTDAHSPSAVCTPTRYGILTGRYSWRTTLQQGVFNGFSGPLVGAKRLTVPALLGQHGYDTTYIGKWHLGWDWARKGEAGPVSGDPAPNEVDFTQPIRNGPTTRGIGSFFGISASLDMPPYIWIENDRTVGVPTVEKAFHRPGPAHADFEAVDVLPALVRRAVDYIHAHAQRKRAARPFFLYLALTAPHTPLVPTPQWAGKSRLGLYGAFVMETDWAVGEVVSALDRSGLGESTLVILTSDNGYAPYAGVESAFRENAVHELESRGHFPSGPYRGYKADIWEGGHRIPFIARWPGNVRPASTSTQTICLTDLMATSAELVGARVPPDAGEDSVSILPALRGTDRGPLRDATVHHSVDGRFSIRQGRFKLILCAGSGGWSRPRDAEARELGLPPVQLYDLEADPGERHNLQGRHPEVVARLTKLLERYVAEGRSTPGAPQTNDALVDLWKPLRR
jgi:arylsulfatase A